MSPAGATTFTSSERVVVCQYVPSLAGVSAFFATLSSSRRPSTRTSPSAPGPVAPGSAAADEDCGAAPARVPEESRSSVVTTTADAATAVRAATAPSGRIPLHRGPRTPERAVRVSVVRARMRARSSC